MVDTRGRHPDVGSSEFLQRNPFSRTLLCFVALAEIYSKLDVDFDLKMLNHEIDPDLRLSRFTKNMSSVGS